MRAHTVGDKFQLWNNNLIQFWGWQYLTFVVVLFLQESSAEFDTLVKGLLANITQLKESTPNKTVTELQVLVRLEKSDELQAKDSWFSFRLQAVPIYFRSPASLKQKKKYPRENWGPHLASSPIFARAFFLLHARRTAKVITDCS